MLFFHSMLSYLVNLRLQWQIHTKAVYSLSHTLKSRKCQDTVDLTFNLNNIIFWCYRSLHFYCCLRGRCCIKLCCCNKSFTAHLGAQPPNWERIFIVWAARNNKAALAIKKRRGSYTRRFMIASRRLPLGLLNCNWAARNFHLSPVSSGLHYARARDCRKPFSRVRPRLFSACRMRLLVAAPRKLSFAKLDYTALTSAHKGPLILLFRLTSSILSCVVALYARTFETRDSAAKSFPSSSHCCFWFLYLQLRFQEACAFTKIGAYISSKSFQWNIMYHLITKISLKTAVQQRNKNAFCSILKIV